ncbi:hypothetical protein [Clostridium senegalense]|uniref:hypothetical protein n=1 Tax=Clostridium senegalense TaxID=1465809 RepID=UPI0002880B4E|nr:hypothetical protein [Clostridium senegalense]
MFLMELQLKERKSFLDLAQYTMKVDRYVTASESWMLKKFSEECGFFDNAYIPRKRQLDDISKDFENSRKKIKNIVIFELYRMILADGVFHEKQRELVDHLAKQWDFTEDEISEIINLSQELIEMALKSYKRLSMS